MTRLLAVLADYWLLVALGAVVLAAVALVGFGRRPRAWWPALAVLLIAGYFAFAGVADAPRGRWFWGFRPWEAAAWAALAVAGLFALVLLNLVLSGHWWRPLAWMLTALLAVALGGFVEPVQAPGVSAVRPPRTPEFV